MKNLYIIDAYNLIYRMFYAVPEMHTRTGEPVNALFGVIKFLKSLSTMDGVDAIVIAGEGGRSFRETLFSEYKGTRDRMPDNLRSQIDVIFEFFRVANIPLLVEEGYEADDIIGSLAIQMQGIELVIISSDKDLCQFVEDGRVRIFDAMKQKNLRRADVIEKFWIPPEQVVDYLAIVGDSSDNIPGISGFGPKKAVDLLSKYGSLDGIYAHLDELTEKMRTTLEEQRENAFLSQKLATIVTDIDISHFQSSICRRTESLLTPEVIEFLKKYEFKSLIPAEFHDAKKELPKWKTVDILSYDQLHDFLEWLDQHGEILFDMDDETIAIGYRDIVYRIDPKSVDITEFIDFLANPRNPIRVIGFQLKEVYKKLLAYKKPLQEVEGQGRLF